MSKLMKVEQAIDLIKDGMTIAVDGFVGCAHPEEISIAVEKKFLETGSPRNLTLLYTAGQGDGKTKGLNHFGHEGLVKRAIGAHWALAPKLGALAMSDKIEGYNFPQGVLSQMFRNLAAKGPGIISHVGLKTYVDPRLEGGKINKVTTEDLVKVIIIDDKEYLHYKPIDVDVAVIRGTYADEKGNVTMEREGVTICATSLAQATKNCGGKVIVQVEKVVKANTLDPRLVKVPGIYVDAIVVSSPENHMQTFAEQYNPSYSGEVRVPTSSLEPLPLDERKIIARRSAMELVPNAVINLGIGMPDGISAVANEEGIEGLCFTVESGPIGGIPAKGLSFGVAANPDAIIDAGYQFDFYNGGGIDVAFLGLAQCDQKGNVNVSKFGPRLAGCGGFIDITQNAKKTVYCGTFTAGKLKINIENGNLKIANEGESKKLINSVEQVTFSGDYAREKKQTVVYVTERAVFELKDEGFTLTEIAPGIDLEKDVLAHMEFKPIISDNLKLMDKRIFEPELMGLKL